ncbi:helicase-related protein [Fusobacterium nucleatum]|uniref:helicase-related protein n=1 Tax=Fusobacterium nucleatum TaxID=851 RepID=UPI00201AB4C9|nr:helicase-related protein [Fusobacterium nucleatum]MCL4584659.1 helicase [Fusobacterium nucleatum YWH7055]
MNDLTFFTNEEGKTLSDRFKKIISNNTQFFDVLVGYFRASGFYEIYEALENVEKIRILVGINVDEKALVINNIAKSSDEKDYYFTPKETKLFTKKSIREEMENSDDNYDIDFGTKKFIEFIEKEKIEIRVYSKEKIHAKVYIMRKDLEKSEDYGKVVTGSSNFTYNGLKGNLEFNVELKNFSDVEFALKKFEELWEQSLPLNEEYVSTLKNETWIREDITPYELYLKFLFEYFSDEINEDKIEINVSDLPEGFISYKYQLDAVSQAKRMLLKYNGVFLADVVGLGKTYITALLARELYGGHKLVICPPVLKNYWEDVLRDFGVVAKVVSLGKLDDVLKNYDSEHFKYIFVDEAHRFRSDNTENYTKLSKICTGKKVILISATPQNNSPMDLLSLISLFQYKNESNIIEDEPDIEKFFKKLNLKYKKAKNLYETDKNEDNLIKLREVIKENSTEIREKVLKKIMVRRLRGEIKKYYKNDIEKQGLVFPNLGKPEQIIYIFDKKTDDIFKQLLEAIKKLNYSRYKTLTYLKDLSSLQNLLVGQINMQGFMKALLLKRLESSFFAFKNTIRRFKESYEKFLKMYEQGDIYISKKYNVYDLLLNEDDEILLDLILKGEVEKYSSDEFKEELKNDLEDDLNILNDMFKNIESLGEKDIKLEYFLDSLEENKILKESKLIVFTESKETAEYLSKKIEEKLNRETICYTGASSLSKKETIIANFDPNFKGKQENRYNILVATDVLAEGINLHRSNVIVNYDLPWNPTRVMQRIGRINRVGTKYDKIYVFNFFPTTETDKHLSLKENILNKIQAFHHTLGEDFKYLSDDEEIDSFALYDKLMTSLDDNEEIGETELEYLSLIRKIRDSDEGLYLKIKNLPKKSKSSREYKEKSIKNSTISFLKKGENKRIYITDNKLDTKELTFFDAINYFKCRENEKRREINREFFDLLAMNKANFENKTKNKFNETTKKVGISGQIKKIIDTLKFYKKFSEVEEKKLEKIIEIYTVGKTSKKDNKEILEKCKTVLETANYHKILEVFYESIPEEYKGKTEKRVDKYLGKVEVLLSEYLIGE